MESWTYNDITKQTEKTIAEFMDQVKQQPDHADKLQRANWAFGAYMLWRDIVGDNRDLRDDERLGYLAMPEDENDG